jgi:hypothetical protein
MHNSISIIILSNNISMNAFSFRIAFVIHTCDTQALLHMFFEIHIPMPNIILSIQNCFMSSKNFGSRILLWVGVKHNPNNKKRICGKSCVCWMCLGSFWMSYFFTKSFESNYSSSLSNSMGGSKIGNYSIDWCSSFNYMRYDVTLLSQKNG